jgi:glucosamine kinase
VSERIVVGVDGGGTSTTALVADPSGGVLGTATGGGASPQHNSLREAHDAVQSTIRRALADSGRDVGAVAALTAGIAGLNDESDRQWAESLVTLPGLECEPVSVNDAVVAHAGALRGEPGLIAICGTGSIVLGIGEDGREIRNYDLDHYAAAAARHLGRRLVHQLVSDRCDEPNEAFVEDVLAAWDLDDRAELQTAAVDGDLLDTATSGNALDGVAPLITEAAADGVPVAQRVCDAAAREIVTGIEAVAGYVGSAPTTVALSGSVLRSPSMTDRVTAGLDERRFEVVEPALDPVAGATLLGLERITDTDQRTVTRLARQPNA